MFKPRHARELERSDLVRAVRRVLFTHSVGPTPYRFELQSFYQHGTGIVLLRHGMVYLLTPSHVVRNATANNYSNDSPFWVTRSHEQPDGIADFLMPMRFHDADPGGDSGRDVAIAELAVPLRPVHGLLDWGDPSLFIAHPREAADATAIATGYPAEVNEYTFAAPDYRAFANIARATFRGILEVDGGEIWFRNHSHQQGYDLAGLSGGAVIASIGGRAKMVGVVLSSGDGGRRFRVLPFQLIRSWLEPFDGLPWEVQDEAFFMGRMTHQTISYADWMAVLDGGPEPQLKRTNMFLDQLGRTMQSPIPEHWIGDLKALHNELRARLMAELARSLRQVAGVLGSTNKR